MKTIKCFMLVVVVALIATSCKSSKTAEQRELEQYKEMVNCVVNACGRTADTGEMDAFYDLPEGKKFWEIYKKTINTY